MEFFAITDEKNLPSGVVAGGAGPGESEFVHAQGQQKTASLGRAGFRGEILRGHSTQDRGETFAAKTELLAAAFRVQIRQHLGDGRLHGSGDRYGGAHLIKEENTACRCS